MKEEKNGTNTDYAIENGNDKIIDKFYFDYPSAFSRVMKSWYEKRIKEETVKNKKL